MKQPSWEIFAMEKNRRRVLNVALNIAKGTHLEPKVYERMLLEQFVQGELTLDQVMYRLDVHQQYNPFA
jgi:hypothetical protein